MRSDEATMGFQFAPAELTAPAPSAALLERVNGAKRVRTRTPLLALLAVAGIAAAYPLYALLAFPLRADLPGLPPLWFAAIGLLWLGGCVLPLARALLPARRQVLPDAAAAGRAALLTAAALIAVGLLLTVDAPQTLVPPRTWGAFAHYWWHCISFGMRIEIPAVVAGAIALRPLAPIGPGRLGAAVGAAGGALAGLTLHGLCPFGGALHVGLAHGGGIVVGALLGAAAVRILAALPTKR